MATLKEIKFYFQIVCAIGVFLSAYAFYVETNVEIDKEYKAYCDISDKISCTKAFSSKWGKGFGLVEKILGEDSVLYQPNSVYGILFYLIMGGLDLSDNKYIVRLQIFLGFLSNLMSIYLGHILYYELEDMCLVCVGTYLINVILLVMSAVKWSLLVCSKCSPGPSNIKPEIKTKSE